MAQNEQQENSAWLVEDWTRQLAQILETMAGERPVFTVAARGEYLPPTQPASQDSEAVLWWEQPLSLAPEALLWVGAPGPSWLALGRLALRGAGLEHIEEADARSTYLEILSQSLSGLVQTLSSRLATEVTCAPGSLVPEPPGACALFEVQMQVGTSALPALFMALSAVILDEIGRPPAAEAGQAPAGSAGPSQSARNLDLLMEVELPVSISFGRARLPLKDVLKLTTGSIVELNRAVSEPVEVIINNCVIARGEVVVAEGNYGVRIQEILSRQERLRTLK